MATKHNKQRKHKLRKPVLPLTTAVPVYFVRDTEAREVPIAVADPVPRNGVRIHQRLAVVYDMSMPDGRVYRWDSREEAERFALVHGIRKPKYSPLPTESIPTVRKALLHSRTLGWDNLQVLRKTALRQAHRLWRDDDELPAVGPQES